jgi:hypothetical protein
MAKISIDEEGKEIFDKIVSYEYDFSPKENNHSLFKQIEESSKIITPKTVVRNHLVPVQD